MQLGKSSLFIVPNFELLYNVRNFWLYAGNWIHVAMQKNEQGRLKIWSAISPAAVRLFENTIFIWRNSRNLRCMFFCLMNSGLHALFQLRCFWLVQFLSYIAILSIPSSFPTIQCLYCALPIHLPFPLFLAFAVLVLPNICCFKTGSYRTKTNPMQRTIAAHFPTVVCSSKKWSL